MPTARSSCADGGQRLQGVPYDAAGRPLIVQGMHPEWNALGQLLRLRHGAQNMARYVYNAQGGRVGKSVGAGPSATPTLSLYNDARQRIAEFDAQGRILRQYVWLGTWLIATIDSPKGASPAQASNPDGLLQTVQAWANEAWSGVRQRVGAHRVRVAYILSNHLGAPFAATDEQAHVIWRAQDSTYGRGRCPDAAATLDSALLCTRIKTRAQPAAFDLALRLHGQWEDDESGLHVINARCHDPDTGRYVITDTLRLAGGLDACTDVTANPVAWIDSRGLLRMAFDGAGNSGPTADKNFDSGMLSGNSPRNVWKFDDIDI